MKLAPLAVFVKVNCGAFNGTLTDAVQRAVVAGQVGSPPPVTEALFTTGLVALLVGVTGITKLELAPTANPDATVQVTTCNAFEQPAGMTPSVNPVGIVSVIVETAVVAAVPVFVRVSV